MSANIDCARQLLSSELLKEPVHLHLTAKGLSLVDMNALIRAAMDKNPGCLHAFAPQPAETFVSDETDKRATVGNQCQPLERNHEKAGSQVKSLVSESEGHEHASVSKTMSHENTTHSHPFPAACQQADRVQPNCSFRRVAVTEAPEAPSS
jgi:hypothetical protein